MQKIILLFILAACVIPSFAQNAKTKKLAKKQAQAICDCPSTGIIETFYLDFRDKKITVEEFTQGMKFAYVEMEKCMRPLRKKLNKLSSKEQEFLKKESERYRLEICPFVENEK